MPHDQRSASEGAGQAGEQPGEGATLALSDEQARWLSIHLEGWLSDHPVNTEPEVHGIVSELHHQGY
jgi:hypothetical protein